MRCVLIALALAIAPQASAQDAPNISGFRLGMSVEEARGVAPDLFRLDTENRPLFRVTQHSHTFGAVRLPLSLVFADGVLDYAGGSTFIDLPSGEACLERLQTVVDELEATVGPLPDSEAVTNANSRVRDLEPARTDGGSYIRRYVSDTGMGAEATASAPVNAEVRASAWQQTEQWQCSITYGMSASAPIPADLPQSSIENWEWIMRPEARDFARYYPTRAMEVSRPGHVILICTVAADGTVTCSAGYENPTGWGFGEAALRIARHFRIAPQTTDGTPTAGATIRVPIRFQVAS